MQWWGGEGGDSETIMSAAQSCVSLPKVATVSSVSEASLFSSGVTEYPIMLILVICYG